MDLGEREISFYSFKAIFDNESTIDIVDSKTDELLVRLQPSDLSSLYWAYIGMKKEKWYNKRGKHTATG